MLIKEKRPQILHTEKINPAEKYAIIIAGDTFFPFWFFLAFSKFSIMSTNSAMHAF